MQPPITEAKKREVFSLWLAGIPRDEVAAQARVATGTVSSIIKEYTQSIDDLPRLRALAVEFNRNHMSAGDAAKGCRIIRCCTYTDG
jgi:hypothetical protein